MKTLINVVILAWMIMVIIAAIILDGILLVINHASYYARNWVCKEGMGIWRMICARLNWPEP